MLTEVFKVRCIDNITVVFAYNQKPVLIIDYFFGHPVKVSKSLFMEIDEISCLGWMIKPFCKFVPRFRKNYRDTVKPYVDGQAWDYEVYIDPNGDFRRAMNVQNVPHTFLVNGEGKIIWQHNSYSEGDEYELYDFCAIIDYILLIE